MLHVYSSYCLYDVMQTCLSQTHLSVTKFCFAKLGVVSFYGSNAFFFPALGNTAPRSAEHCRHAYSAVNLQHISSSLFKMLLMDAWHNPQELFLHHPYTENCTPAETRVNRGFQVPSLQCVVSMLLTAYSLLLCILLLQWDLIWAYALSIIYWILCL